MNERVQPKTLNTGRLFVVVLTLVATVIGFLAGLPTFYGAMDHFMGWGGNALMGAGALPPITLAIILLALCITGAVSVWVSEWDGKTPAWTFAGSVVAAAMYCLVVWAIADHVPGLLDRESSLYWALSPLLLASFLAGFYAGIGLLAAIAILAVSSQQWVFEQ